MDPISAPSPGWLPFVVGFLRSLVMPDLRVEILPPVASGQAGSFRIKFTSTSPSIGRVDGVKLVWKVKNRAKCERHVKNAQTSAEITVPLPVSGLPEEVEAVVDCWEPPQEGRPMEAVLKVKLNRLIRSEWEFPIRTVPIPVLGPAVDPKRIRQLVVKDNEIADHEHKGLSIESGPVEHAFWHDDEIEFRSSIVLRNSWMDSWRIRHYEGQFRVGTFVRNYELVRAIHVHDVRVGPLSTVQLRFSTRWNPEKEVREYLGLCKRSPSTAAPAAEKEVRERLSLCEDTLVRVSYDAYVKVSYERESEEPMADEIKDNFHSCFYIKPRPSTPDGSGIGA